MSKENTLLMKFLNQEHDFAEGFECGRFYEMMTNGYEFNDHLFNLKNEEQIKLMATRFFYDISIEKSDDWYGYLTAKKDISKAN